MATISEDYVSFETAKLLKEEGFDIGVRYYYQKINDDITYHVGDFRNWNVYDMWYSMPTLQMAMKWLVRKYKLYVNVVPSVEGYYWTEKWHSYVEDLKKRYPFGKFISTFNSREEACEAAIKYCLENLI